MAIDKGMNVAEVRALAQTLQASADKVDAQLRTLDQLVKRAAWSGPVANKFKGQWWPGHRSTMSRMAADLRGFSRSARTNADEQDTASGSTSGAGGGGSSGQSGGSWFDDVRGRIGGTIDAVIAVGGHYEFISDFKELAKLKGLESLFRPAAKLDGPLAILGTGWHVAKLFDAVSDGNVDSSIRSGIDVVFDVGSLYPPIGWSKGAWDFGWEVGDKIDWLFGEKLGGHQAFIDSVIDDQYGGSLSPSEADDLAHRYDGWSGFGNFAFDGARNTADAATSLFNKVFG